MSPTKSSELWHPGWTVVLPFLALTALLLCPVEQRLPVAVISAFFYSLMQWLFPRCRWRRHHYFCPVNVALAMLLLKLCIVPIFVMLTGSQSRVLTFLPTFRSMQGAILIDTVAYVAFCLALTLAPKRPLLPKSNAIAKALSHSPSRSFIWIFVILGLAGFAAVFDSLPRMLLYFNDPTEMTSILQELEGSWRGLLATILRPFLAFSLIAWWATVADDALRSQRSWRPAIVGVVAAIGITLANLTFSFNRAAFVFPLICMTAVHSARVRRIPFGITAAFLALAMPILVAIAAYRSAGPDAAAAADNSFAGIVISISENLQAYCVGPQYTAIFLDHHGWGEHLFGGSTLVASIMAPVPLLGKGFRETSGPAIFNYTIYGVSWIEDQIIPFSAELFANFHLPGVIAGFMLLAFLLSQAELWFAAAPSIFAAFSIQYASLWAAMLSVWSVAIYSQILIYFFVPIYFYLAALTLLAWLKAFGRRSPAPTNFARRPLGVTR